MQWLSASHSLMLSLQSAIKQYETLLYHGSSDAKTFETIDVPIFNLG